MNRTELVNSLTKKGFRPDGAGGFTKEPLSESKSYAHKTSTVVAGIPYAIAKHDAREALEPFAQTEKGSEKRTTVRIERRSRKLLDADNYGGGAKYTVDSLRYEGYLKNDDPGTCRLIFDQTKVQTKEEEGTLIEITYP